MLTLQSGESDQESVYGTEQQRLREESRAYRLKLQAYQDSQQKQAQLVHKLQAKVHQALLIFILTLHLQQIHPHCILSYLERNSVVFIITVWLLHCRCFSIKRDLEIWSSRCWRKHQNWKSCVSQYDMLKRLLFPPAAPFTFVAQSNLFWCIFYELVCFCMFICSCSLTWTPQPSNSSAQSKSTAWTRRAN